MDFIPTKAYLAKKSTKNVEFQSVTYEAYKPKNKQGKAPQEVQKPQKDKEFNIKQAKHEVIKFGTSGFDPEKKQQAKIELAIKLGAKPPKKTYINYKQLLSERKKQKEAETSRLNFQQLGKTSAGKSTAKGKSFDRKRRKKRPTSSGILGEYGVVKTKR